MDAEKKAEKTVELYRQLAKDDKNVDLAALTTAMLEQTRQSETEAKKKRLAYLISAGLPPLGLIFAVRYYFSENSDGKRVAAVCVILTIVSLLASWLIAKMFLSSVGSQLDQIQSINSEDLKSLLQP